MPATDSKAATIFANRGQVTAALQRAADRARLIAEQTGTKLVVAVPPQSLNVTDKSVKTVQSVANEN